MLWQVTSCQIGFEIGSLPPILGKISTSPANRDIAILGRGSLRVTPCQSGRLLDIVPYYGLTGNVSCCSALTFPQRLTVFTFRSGRWQERPLVCESFHIFV